MDLRIILAVLAFGFVLGMSIAYSRLNAHQTDKRDSKRSARGPWYPNGATS